MSSSAVFPPRRGTRLGVRREEGAAGGLCGFEGGVILQSCTFRVKFWTLQRALVELRESERASEREKVSPWPQRHHLLALCPAVGRTRTANSTGRPVRLRLPKDKRILHSHPSESRGSCAAS